MKKFSIFLVFFFLFSLIPSTVFGESEDDYKWNKNNIYSPVYYGTNFIFNTYDVENLSINYSAGLSVSDVNKVNNFFANNTYVSYSSSGYFAGNQHYDCSGFALISADRHVLFIVGSSYSNQVGCSINADNNSFTVAWADNSKFAPCGYYVSSIDDLDLSKKLCFIYNPPTFPTSAPFGYTDEQAGIYMSDVAATSDSWSLVGGSEIILLNHLDSGSYNISDFISNSNVAVSSELYSTGNYIPTDTQLTKATRNLQASSSQYYTLNQETQSKFNQILQYVQNIDVDMSDVVSAINDFASNVYDYFDGWDSDGGIFYDLRSYLDEISSSLNITLRYFAQLVTGGTGSPVITGGKSLLDIYNAIRTGFDGLGSFFEITYNWQSFTSSISSTFKSVLEDVETSTMDMVNPQSPNNIVAFNSALDNVNNNTVFGSASQMVSQAQGIFDSIKNPADSDGHFVFQTLGVQWFGQSISPFNVDINLSWLSPYRDHIRNVLRAFIWVSWIFLFWRRLPALISGMPLDTFYERDEVPADIVTNDIYLDASGYAYKSTTTTRQADGTTIHQINSSERR